MKLQNFVNSNHQESFLDFNNKANNVIAEIKEHVENMQEVV